MNIKVQSLIYAGQYADAGLPVKKKSISFAKI